MMRRRDPATRPEPLVMAPAAPAPALTKKVAEPAPRAVNMYVVYALCIFPAAVSVCASLSLEALHAHRARVAAYLPLAVLACVGFAAAVALTHGVSGRLVHPSEWKFYQPLRGGWRFIVLQLLSWLSLVAVLLVGIAWFYDHAGGMESRQGMWSIAAVAGILAEALMVASIKLYDAKAMSPLSSPAASPLPSPRRPSDAGVAPAAAAAAAATTTTPTAAAAPARAPWSRRQQRQPLRSAVHLLLHHDLPVLLRTLRAAAAYVRMVAVVAFLSNTQAVLALLLLAPFAVLPMPTALYAFIGVWAAYGVTYYGRPEKTGRRFWPAFTDSFVFRDVVRWFNGQVVFDGALDPKRQYIFGFAPHGIMPLTASWLAHHPAWRATVGANRTVTLGATVFQLVPVIRELALWAGTRVVSRDSFQKVLAEGKSALLIPGGMAEMRLSRSEDRHIRLVTYHKGFVAMALRTGTPLVPVFSFGETRYFDQLELFGVSRWMHRWMGIPLPYFRGPWGLPVPRRVPVTVVVGRPIEVPKVAEPSPGLIDQYTALFYSGVLDVFERHKHALGHGDCTLVTTLRLHGGQHVELASGVLHPVPAEEAVSSTDAASESTLFM